MRQDKKEKKLLPGELQELAHEATAMLGIQSKMIKAYRSPELLTDIEKHQLARGRIRMEDGESPMPILHILLANESVSAVKAILTYLVKQGEVFALQNRIDFEAKTLLILAAKMGPPGEEICAYILKNLSLFGGAELLKFRDVDGCTAAHYLYMYGSKLGKEIVELCPSIADIRNKQGSCPVDYLMESDADFIDTVARSVSIDLTRSQSATSNQLMLEGCSVINEKNQRIKSHPDSLKAISEKLFFAVPDIQLGFKPAKEKLLTIKEVNILKTVCRGLLPRTLSDQIHQNRRDLLKELKMVIPDQKREKDIKLATVHNFHAPISPGKLFADATDYLKNNQFDEAILLAQQIVDLYKEKERQNTAKPVHLRSAYYFLGRAQWLQFQYLQSKSVVADLALLGKAEKNIRAGIEYDSKVQQGGSADSDSEACRRTLSEITKTQSALKQTPVNVQPPKVNLGEKDNPLEEEDPMAVRMSNPLRQCIVL